MSELHIDTITSNAENEVTIDDALVVTETLHVIGGLLIDGLEVSGFTVEGYYLRNTASGEVYSGPLTLIPSDIPTLVSATKIANGTVDNTEFQYLNGVTSNVQTQLNTISIPVSKADQIAGNDAFNHVTPDVQQYHGSAAKAWAYITYSGGVPTIQKGYNIDSINDVNVGKVTIIFTIPFSSTSYCMVGSASYKLGVEATVVGINKDADYHADHCGVTIWNHLIAPYDTLAFSVVFFGEQ